MPAKREAVGLWPRALRNHLAFMPSLARVYFCHIARSDDIDVFLCCIAMSEQQYYNFFIVLRERASDDAQRCIFYVVLQ